MIIRTSLVLLIFCFVLSLPAAHLSLAQKLPYDVDVERGYLAPDFQLQDLSSASIRLSDLRQKKPVLLFFWTTWCPYCLKELKKMNTEIKELKKEGLEIVIINVGESTSKVIRTLKRNNIDLRIFVDSDSSVARDYAIVGLPTFVMTDKNGYIRFMDYYLPSGEERNKIYRLKNAR